MASGSESGKSVDSNKENNDMDKEGTVGIEANDLATLLNRFEEATSSDDINVPRPVHKAKWNIMKFKSAGNSPAATPPATPPPSGPILMKTFTTKASPAAVRSQTLPIRLTVVNPIPTLAQRSTLPSASSTKLSSAPSQPKINIQISKPGLSSAFLVNGHSLLTKSSSKVAQNPAFGPSLAFPISSSPSQLQRQIITVPFPSDSTKSSVETSSLHLGASNTAPITKTFNVLRMPALDAASSFNMESSSIKQIIPKKRSSLMTNAIEIGKKKKLDSSSIGSSVSSSTPYVPLSLKLTQSTKSAPLSSNLLFKEESPPLQGQIVSPSPKTNDINIAVGGKAVGSGQNGISKTLRPQVQKDEHSYCWSGPCFNNKNTSGVGVSTSVSVLQPTEAITEDSFSPCESNLQEREVVLEEGVMFVDSNGNDLCSKETEEELKYQSKEQMCSQPFEEDNSNRIVSFEAAGENVNRRARKYRKRGELRNSPVKEDKSDFYDKIPSHYTALSIPSKQIRKTVFESVSSTLGSQDHLALSTEFEVKEEDEGQYNKVPMHHRIFTNTSQELSNENESSFSHYEEDREERPSRQRRISSTSRHSAHSTSSHRSNRSGSRHSYRGLSSRSRSRSPAGSDYSQNNARNSRPLTRRRRRNSSSQHSASSVSSSCSSNSYCSTCGASLSSRSRSRSFSSDGSRERSFSPQSRYSRSRSRSPRERGGRRRKMSNRSPTPERSNYRSWSRSQSPPVRRRRNSYRTSSRSRRHQLKERSSTERKIMELRKQREEDKVKAMEERRVLYVGKLPDNFSKHQLRKRFECFGEIKGVRLNFRVHGDNYGFVTFTHASDAFAAKEKGNSLQDQPKFDLCFGGRRRFCPDKYADLDGNREIEEEYAPMQSSSKSSGELDYAALLKQHVSAQKKGKR